MVFEIRGVAFEMDGTLYNLLPPLFRFAINLIRCREPLREFLKGGGDPA